MHMYLPQPGWSRSWHIDGTGVNGRVQTFNALVGVYLQQVPEEFCGNLVVFPGSHSLVAQAASDGHTMDLLRREGMPALRELVISKPLQIVAEAGDVLVAHSSLPHSVAPNCSSSIRWV